MRCPLDRNRPTIVLAMIYTISLLLALMFWQADEPKKDLEQLRREAAEAAEKHREEAIRLNDLAGHLKTESDAENLVDSIAKMFADELPPPWATRGVRLRMARAEYAAVTDPAKQIPEEQVASIWNQYVRAIGASEEMIVTPAEVHSLRDLHYGSANLMWANGWNQSIWTIPNVYTVGSDGKIASQCRPLEAMHVFYDLDNHFRNLQAARKHLEKGTSFFDEMQGAKGWKRSLDVSKTRVEASIEIDRNPVRAAELRFMTEHGSTALWTLLKRLTDEFLPE